jgi:hypothetical protein
MYMDKMSANSSIYPSGKMEGEVSPSIFPDGYIEEFADILSMYIYKSFIISCSIHISIGKNGRRYLPR